MRHSTVNKRSANIFNCIFESWKTAQNGEFFAENAPEGGSRFRVNHARINHDSRLGGVGGILTKCGLRNPVPSHLSPSKVQITLDIIAATGGAANGDKQAIPLKIELRPRTSK